MAGARRISDEAVRAKTGKSWEQWFRILDRWGAAAKAHAVTAKHLAERHGIGPWWSQMITARYEMERGLRDAPERPRGYEISVSRVIAAPARRVFECWLKPADLSEWFTSGARVDARVGGRYRNRDGDQGEFLAIRPGRRIRFTWENPGHAPGTEVEVAIAARGRGKVTATLTHSRLGSRRDAEMMREAWSWALDSLRSYAETGAPVGVSAWLKTRRTGSRARPRGG